MTVDAIVDGGGVIDERNDSNNEREATATLTLQKKRKMKMLNQASQRRPFTLEV